MAMIDSVKRTILTRHNSQRNVLALGGNDDFLRPQAADMATMVNEFIYQFLYTQKIFQIILHQFLHM